VGGPQMGVARMGDGSNPLKERHHSWWCVNSPREGLQIVFFTRNGVQIVFYTRNEIEIVFYTC